jgi:SAM-dependent methyltransferase
MDETPRTLDHFSPRDLDRIDPRRDALFYDVPRYVVHIDDGAIAAVGELIRRLAPPRPTVLDLMSSYRSHLPPDLEAEEVVGIGLNADEMAANPQLTRWRVHDLNEEPAIDELPGRVDLALCTVSVQYLTRPLELFDAVRRLLRPPTASTPGGVFLVTFSNRCFPTKAVRLWLEGDDAEHLALVRGYFRLSGGWTAIEAAAHRPPGGDPLYGIWARRGVESQSLDDTVGWEDHD